MSSVTYACDGSFRSDFFGLFLFFEIHLEISSTLTSDWTLEQKIWETKSIPFWCQTFDESYTQHMPFSAYFLHFQSLISWVLVISTFWDIIQATHFKAWFFINILLELKQSLCPDHHTGCFYVFLCFSVMREGLKINWVKYF